MKQGNVGTPHPMRPRKKRKFSGEGPRRLMRASELLLDDLSKADSFAVNRLRDRHRKKYAMTAPHLATAAVDEFVELCETLRGFTHSLTSQEVADARAFIEKALWRYTDSATEWEAPQTSLSYTLLYSLWRFGKKASVGTKAKHPADKILVDWTVTDHARELVTDIRRSNPYFASFDALRGSDHLKAVQFSKLGTVPKNEDTVRVIATEPLGNMLLQLAAGQYIANSLRCIGLDIPTQQAKNNSLAKIGSETGNFFTMDLSKASDRITPSLVAALMPPEWFQLLWRVRTPFTKLPVEEFGDITPLELPMMSTMGNGSTFALMTLLITSLIYAAVGQRGCYLDWSRYAVYGDDIIGPTDDYTAISDILERAGFKINHLKSYCTGTFRESCGGDFDNGVDVTPFYLSSLTTDPEIYVAINQTLDWQAKNSFYLPRYTSYLMSLLRRARFVPEWENPDSGILTSTVARRYTVLLPIPEVVNVTNHHFAVPLICGGYADSASEGFSYCPPAEKHVYRAFSKRLPRGYLDGVYRLRYTPRESSMRDLFIALSAPG